MKESPAPTVSPAGETVGGDRGGTGWEGGARGALKVGTGGQKPGCLKRFRSEELDSVSQARLRGMEGEVVRLEAENRGLQEGKSRLE